MWPPEDDDGHPRDNQDSDDQNTHGSSPLPSVDRVQPSNATGGDGQGMMADGDDSSSPVEPTDEYGRREQRIAEAVASWVNDLLDLGPRNELLYCTPGSAMNIELTEGAVDEDVLRQLLAGESVQIGALVPDPSEQLLKKLRAINSRAAEHWQDRGLTTLALVRGLATWHDRLRQRPSAPVLIAPLTITGRRVSPDSLSLALSGPAVLSPTLRDYAHTMLETDFATPTSVSIDDPSGLYEILTNASGQIDGFEITDRVMIGNFSYAKQAMVEDLRNHHDLLTANPVVSALAGDTHPLVSDHERDHAAAEFVAEHTVLDADGSQTAVLERVLAGNSLVVHGPPGTGKSQSIANLIALLAAAGKSTLFVAEKRAAIDAVLGRLASVGLTSLVTDLHGVNRSRESIASTMAADDDGTLEAAFDSPITAGHPIAESADPLSSHLARSHTPVGSAELSPWDALERIHLLGGPAGHGARLDSEVARALEPSDWERSRAALRHLLSGPADFGPWSRATVDSAEAVDSTIAWARQLAGPARDLAASTGLLEGVTTERELAVAEWSAVVETLVEWHRLAECLGPDAVTTDLAPLAHQLSARGSGVLSALLEFATSPAYRSALRDVRPLLRPGCSPFQAAAVAALIRAAELQDRVSRIGVQLTSLDTGRVKQLRDGFADFLPGLRALSGYLGSPLDQLTIPGLTETIDEVMATRTVGVARCHANAATSALDEVGLLEIATAIHEIEHDPTEALRLFDLTILDALLELHREHGPETPRSLEALIRQFSQSDRDSLLTAPHRVRRAVEAHRRSTAIDHPDEDRTVKAEANRTRPRLTIRDLFAAAPHVVTSLKPCWVMSPLVVSQVLPPVGCFDVVIFDEASQIRPSDAIPAIARAGQVVVAGDEHQLPPSPFFVATTPDEFADSSAVVGGFESILDVLQAVLPTSTLRWHYRSVDDRLIEFSNRRFYGGLATFPPPQPTDCLKLQLVSVPDEADDDHASLLEAERVAELVRTHLDEHPDESLGVITFGLEHADRVLAVLERSARDRPDLLALLEHDGSEHLFVKPVERVQGDERDAIILSVGYPKLPRARLRLTFGPLNHRGGERRLNVAVSRSRRRMTVVSTFDHRDFPLSDDLSAGASALRDYLAYAATGGATPTADNHDAGVLQTIGDPNHPRFASLVRLAAAPSASAEPPTAILTDAPAPLLLTVRDRYRLRPALLEAAGWQIEWRGGIEGVRPKRDEAASPE